LICVLLRGTKLCRQKQTNKQNSHHQLKPQTHRSLPVKNFKNSRCSSADSSSRTIDHSHATAGDAAENPPSYLALRSSAAKSRLGLPHTKRSTSHALKRRIAGPSQRIWNPWLNASNWRPIELAVFVWGVGVVWGGVV
jgi:hypothetical protein